MEGTQQKVFIPFTGAVNNVLSPLYLGGTNASPHAVNVDNNRGALRGTRDHKLIGTTKLAYRYEYQLRGNKCVVADSTPLDIAVYNHKIYHTRYTGGELRVSTCNCAEYGSNSVIMLNNTDFTVAATGLSTGRLLHTYSLAMMRAGLGSIKDIFPPDYEIEYQNTPTKAASFINTLISNIQAIEDSTDTEEQKTLFSSVKTRTEFILEVYKGFKDSASGVLDKSATSTKWETTYKESETACFDFLTGSTFPYDNTKVVTNSYEGLFNHIKANNSRELLSTKWDSSTTLYHHIDVENERIKSDPVYSNSQRAYEWRQLYNDIYERIRNTAAKESGEVTAASDYLYTKLQEALTEAEQDVLKGQFQHTFTVTLYNSCTAIESAPTKDKTYYGALSKDITINLTTDTEADKYRLYYNPPLTANWYLLYEGDTKNTDGTPVTQETITIETDPMKMIGLSQLSTRDSFNTSIYDVSGVEIVKGRLFFFRRNDTRLYYSKQGQPSALKPLQYIEFERSIQHIQHIQNALLVFDGYNNYTVSQDLVVKRVDNDSYLRSPTTVVTRYANVLWLHYQGLKIQMGFGSQSLTAKSWDRCTIPTDTDPTAWSSVLWKDSYWLLHVPTHRLYEFNIRTRTLHYHNAISFVHLYTYEDKMYATTQNGEVYELFTCDKRQGFIYHTPTFGGYRAGLWQEFLTYNVSITDTNKGFIEIKTFIDEKLVLTQKHPTHDYKNKHSDKVIVERQPIPAQLNKGSQVRFELRGKDIELNSLELFYTSHQYEY